MIRTYRQLLVANFAQAAQYRVQFVLWMLFSVIRPTIFLAAWVAVANAAGGSVGGFTATDFAAYYIALTLVSQLTMAWNSHEFEFEIRQGRLSPKLLRPLHPLHYAIVENIVFKATTFPPLLLILAVLALTFNVRFDTQPWQLMLFVPCVVLGAALYFMVNWLTASAAFWLQRVQTVNTLVMRTAFIFSGQIAPIALMPVALQAVCYVLPFYYTLGAPAELLRGGVTVERALTLMAIQVVWLAVATFLFTIVWRAGLRQFSAVGA